MISAILLAQHFLQSLPEREQVLCLAEQIFFESRSEPVIGQVATAQTVMHRMADPRYPSTACEVVHAPGAYQYFNDGKSERIPDNIIERRAYSQAVILAALVSIDALPDVAGQSTHFFSGTVQPWPAEQAFPIGSQVFLVGVP